MDFNNFDDSDTAFTTCSTSELYELGLISDSDLDELFAPWESDTDDLAQAA
jgi:hypothetical protein